MERSAGCFEQAHGGTLFLDEIGVESTVGAVSYTHLDVYKRQPQCDADDDQRQNDVDQRHLLYSPKLHKCNPLSTTGTAPLKASFARRGKLKHAPRLNVLAFCRDMLQLVLYG